MDAPPPSGAADEVAQLRAELDQFAYVVSHDLQEPARTIRSFVQLLARRYEGRLDDDADEFLAYIVEGTERLESMIQDLLAWSRAGTRELEPTDVALDPAVHEAWASVASTDASFTVVGDLPRVWVDPDALHDLLRRLLDNAVKFVDAGAPRVTVRADVAGAPDGMVALTVEDAGIGIDPRFIDRIFGVFDRLHTPEEYPGNGIGLAVVRRLARRLGDDVVVTSAGSGSGSAFTFRLPLAP